MDLTVSIVSKLPKKKSQNPSLCVEKWSSFKSWRRFVVKIMDLTVSYVSKLLKKKCQNPSLCFEKWSSFKSWRRVFIKNPETNIVLLCTLTIAEQIERYLVHYKSFFGQGERLQIT